MGKQMEYYFNQHNFCVIQVSPCSRAVYLTLLNLTDDAPSGASGYMVRLPQDAEGDRLDHYPFPVKWVPVVDWEREWGQDWKLAAGLELGTALALLKAGWRITREDWDEDQWLSLSGPVEGRKINASLFWSPNNATYAKSQPGEEATVLPCVTAKLPSGEIMMGWTPTQADLFANDYRIYCD